MLESEIVNPLWGSVVNNNQICSTREEACAQQWYILKIGIIIILIESYDIYESYRLHGMPKNST